MKIMPMRHELQRWCGWLRPVGLLGLSALLMTTLPARAEGAGRSTAPARMTRAIPAMPDAGQGGVVIDAIAAVVNREAITDSEVKSAAWFARFSANPGKPANLSPIRADEYQQALHHLINEDLLLQEQKRAGYDVIAEAAVQHQIEDLARRMGGAEKLQARLQTFHLQMADLRELIGRQLNILHFLDERLRPSIVIDEKQIDAYYHKDFVPAAQAHRLQPAPLDKVRDEIRSILLEQEMARQQQQWLQQLRAMAVISTRTTSLSPKG